MDNQTIFGMVQWASTIATFIGFFIWGANRTDKLYQLYGTSIKESNDKWIQSNEKWTQTMIELTELKKK